MPTTCKQCYQTGAYNIRKNVKLFQYSVITASHSMCLASFLMQRVWLCLLFTILCRCAGQALNTIYYFLTQNHIQIPPTIASVHPMDSDIGKLPDFDNIKFELCHTPNAYMVFLPEETMMVLAVTSSPTGLFKFIYSNICWQVFKIFKYI